MSSDDEKPPLDAALRHLAEQQRRSLTSHPTPQELAAYHAGELPPEAEAKILDHLAICRECSDLLLDLSGFADLKPPAGVPELTDQQVEEDWQALRAKMREEPEGKPAEVVPIRQVAPMPKALRWNSPLLPVAASLLAVIGLSFAIYQSVQVSRLSGLRAVPAISEEDVERGSENPRISARNGASIKLTPGRDADYPEYEVVLVKLVQGGGEEILERAPAGPMDKSVAFTIPPLEPGTYSLRLYGLEGGERKLSSEIPFEAQ